MTALEALNLAAPLADTYSAVEQRLLIAIARQISLNDDHSLNEVSKWQIKRLARLGMLRKDAARIVAAGTKGVPADFADTVQQAITSALAEDGLVDMWQDESFAESAKQAVKHYRKQAQDVYNQVNTVMKYKAESSFVRAVNTVADKWTQEMRRQQAEIADKQAVLDILNSNTADVVNGSAARTRAVRTTIHEMAQRGIPAFVDRAGREWSPEAYVNMDIRATVKNTALEAKFSVMDSLGQDVFEVSSHPGSRPKCRPWQGKLISRSGKTTEITDLHGRKHKVIPLSQTSFGEPDGLFGINCGHRPRGCTEGVFTKSAVEYGDAEDKALYNKVCQQRELERKVRKFKTEADMLEAAGDTEGARAVRQRMSEQNRQLRAYCESNGLKYRSDRVRTYGSVKPYSDKERRSAITAEMNRPTVQPEIKQSRFIPAQTIQEAEEFAGRYIETRLGDKTFKGIADFKGISLEHANDINRALADVFDKYDIPKISGIKVIDPNSAKGKKIFTSADAVMAYSPVEHGVYINKSVLKNPAALAAYNRQAQQAWNTVMGNIDSLTGAQRETALRYKNAGRSLVGDGSAHDYFVHEMGHHIQWEAFDAKTNNAVGSRMSQYAGGISGYATASKSEYFAESFAAFEKGEFDKLDPDFVAFLRGKSLDKSAGSGIIKADGEPSRFRFDKMTSEQRKEVIQKGVSVKKPVFSYDRPDNQAMSRLQRTAPMADNVFDVISHGSATTIEFFKQDFPDSDIRGHIDAFTLSCILKSRSDYKAFIKACKQKGVEPYIRLLSCRTGDTTDTGNCFGQLLANELGIKVYAPNDEILVKHNGLFDIGEHRDGDMILFYPRK